MNIRKFSALRASAAPFVLGVAMLSTSAQAQDTTTPAEGSVDCSVQADDPSCAEGKFIVVTGSRIARAEAVAAQPLTVVDNQSLKLDAAQNIQDTLNELPQVAIGFTRTNSNFLTNGTGVATINLRNLGSSRTLTLVNGRRFIAGLAGDSAVDVNNIPTDFVERVEVVTGGSSAVYGSDAIAGVVNFVLKDSYEGLMVRAQGNITEKGDNPRYLVSVTGGTKFGADDRGNILLNFTYDHDGGLRSRKRAISAQDCNGTLCGPAAYSSYAAQGRFQLVDADGNAQNILNGGSTSLFTFNPTNNLVYGFPVGFGFNRNGERYISVPIDRYMGAAVGNYEISSNVTAFAEVTYSKVKSRSRLEPTPLDWTDIYFNPEDPVGIPLTNPFIPTAVRDQIDAVNSDADPDNDVAGVAFRRRQNGIFDRSNVVERDTWRAVAGFRGDVGKFNWEVSGVYGHVRDYNASEDIDNARYRNALDAVRVGPGNVVGTDIVCRSAQARQEGCIPINLFGYSVSDPRAAAYVQSVVPKSELINNKQYVLSASVSGPLFELPAGDLGIALGAEYRKESSVDDLDTLTNSGGNSGNVIPDTRGSFNVKEVFGEVRVPLFSGTPFIEYFGLTGAARYSDYSTIGNTFSWNAGAEWEPVSGLRFRGQYAEANRAPNISELFSAPSETFASVSDPCDGVTASAALDGLGAACRSIPAVAAAIAANGVFEYTLADLQGINGFVGGNRNLKEETAKTYTIGMTWQPSFARNLLLTADFYDITVDGAIASLGRSYSIKQCLATGLAVYCDNVTRNAATGFVTQVNGQLINVAKLHTRGIDFGLRAQQGLGLLGKDSINLSVNYTYLIDDEQQGDPADVTRQFAGTVESPRHRVNARLTYTIENVSISWQTLYRSGGKYDNEYVSANPALVALNKKGSYMTHDLQLRTTIGDEKPFEFYAGVDNVFNKKPYYIPGAPFGTPTGLETSPVYDVFGRRYYAGVTFRY